MPGLPAARADARDPVRRAAPDREPAEGVAGVLADAHGARFAPQGAPGRPSVLRLARVILAARGAACLVAGVLPPAGLRGRARCGEIFT